MNYNINNNFSIVCYYWCNGAYVSGHHSSFEEALAYMIKQYGHPSLIKRALSFED